MCFFASLLGRSLAVLGSVGRALLLLLVSRGSHCPYNGQQGGHCSSYWYREAVIAHTGVSREGTALPPGIERQSLPLLGSVGSALLFILVSRDSNCPYYGQQGGHCSFSGYREAVIAPTGVSREGTAPPPGIERQSLPYQGQQGGHCSYYWYREAVIAPTRVSREGTAHPPGIERQSLPLLGSVGRALLLLLVSRDSHWPYQGQYREGTAPPPGIERQSLDLLGSVGRSLLTASPILAQLGRSLLTSSPILASIGRSLLTASSILASLLTASPILASIGRSLLTASPILASIGRSLPQLGSVWRSLLLLASRRALPLYI